MRSPVHFPPRRLRVLAAIVPSLCATLAFAQLPARSSTSPPATFTVRPATAPVTAPAGGSTPAPGTGSATLPAGVGAPTAGTGAAVVAPLATVPRTTVTPDTAGAGSVPVVPGSTRGVVVIPGAPAPAAIPGSTATPLPGTTPGAMAGSAGTVDAGAATVVIDGVVVTPGLPSTGGVAQGLTGGTPSVSPQSTVDVRGPLTALQIAQFFLQADGDADGLLSRAEALRLPVVTMTFEDMDRNRDGVVSRSEYSDSLQ